MKEYTALSLVSVILPIWLDFHTKCNLLKRKRFYVFLGIIFIFKLMVNGFLTAEGIVVYNPEFYLGIRVTSIPLEDFLFAFSMVSTTIILWEFFKKGGGKCEKSP
jgi:lycopene cyclase domain-containing protein